MEYADYRECKDYLVNALKDMGVTSGIVELNGEVVEITLEGKSLRRPSEAQTVGALKDFIVNEKGFSVDNDDAFDACTLIFMDENENLVLAIVTLIGRSTWITIQELPDL